MQFSYTKTFQEKLESSASLIKVPQRTHAWSKVHCWMHREGTENIVLLSRTGTKTRVVLMSPCVTELCDPLLPSVFFYSLCLKRAACVWIMYQLNAFPHSSGWTSEKKTESVWSVVYDEVL